MLKKLFKTIIFSFLFSVVSFLNFSHITYANQLDDVFEGSEEHLIVEGNVSDWNVKWWFHNTMKLLLKITIMIWMAVFLYGWIRFLLSMWDDSKAKKTRDTLLTSALWFVIAFWAWAILELMLSAWTTLRTLWGS